MIQNLLNFFLICFALSFKFQAQEPYSQHFSHANGLPSNAVYSILEDKNGFIWFTCDEGLYRYDGTFFKPFRAPNQTSYSGSSILEDATGRIWYVDFDGNAFFVNGKNLQQFQQKSTTNFYQLKATDKYIFIQEQFAILAVELKTLKIIKRFKTKNFIHSSSTLNNAYYYVDGNSLFKISANLEHAKVCNLPMLENEFPLIATQGDKLIFTKKNSAINGIWLFDNGKISKQMSFSQNVIVQNLKVIDDDLLLITSKGIWKMSKNEILDDSFLFQDKNVSDIILDRKGNYWLSSSVDGIDLIPDINVQSYKFENLQPLRVRAFGNRLLITSKNETVTWFSPSSKSFELFSSGNSNAIPYFIFIDTIRNQLVRVQSDGYTYFSDLKSKQLLNKARLAIKHISYLDEKYNMLVASGFIGFYCHKSDLKKKSKFDLEIQKLKTRTEGDFYFFSLPIDGRGKSTCYDKNTGKAYFVTNLGLTAWLNGSISKEKLPKSIAGLTSMVLWKKELFGLSIDGRVRALKNSENNRFSELTKLKNARQIRIIENYLFVRMPDQLSVFEMNSSGKIKLKNSLFLSGVESSDFALMNGAVWLMTSDGIISWEFQKNLKSRRSGQFRIVNVLVVGKQIHSLQNKRLSRENNNIKIDFALLDFGKTTISQLSYKLNDNAWVPIEANSRSLVFPALAYGNYKLEINGMLGDKFQNLETFSFEITRPFWSTNWFYGLVFAIAVIVVILYFRSKMQRSEERNVLIKDKILLESSLNKSLLASIKSQMNPHFIFNALNTIQAYIYINDKENATNYLSKFSKLTRSVLEMSEKETVPLSTEIESLTLYLDLEKMRFQDNFRYEFKFENLDLNAIQIPSMLIQPYIENAIKHGLLHSEGEKILIIKMSRDENCLNVEIDDNGIGRKRSEALRIQRDKYHVGFSTKANELRINLLSANKEASVQYIDKMSHDGQATGTTVLLKITLNK